LPASLTLAEASQLLRCSRPTVEQRIREGRLVRVDGTSPTRVDAGSVIRELERLIVQTTTELHGLMTARDQLMAGEQGTERLIETQQLADHGGLVRELESERTGRALAEARIDQLKADLNRANLAIQALLVDPDAGVS
jgi:hypothetical protein